MALDCT